eukprot:657026-Pyramimonas_sp.AAC.1
MEQEYGGQRKSFHEPRSRPRPGLVLWNMSAGPHWKLEIGCGGQDGTAAARGVGMMAPNQLPHRCL